MTMPSFLIVGAAKSGTSALYQYLRQHPEVFMSPVKSTNFFALQGTTPRFVGPEGVPAPVNAYSVTDLQAYRALFTGAGAARAVGEASPIYLYSEQAPANIERHLPNVRLVAVLRNPVERAFSSYLHLIRDGREPLSFEEGLKQEAARIRDNYGPLYRYTDMGYYSTQVERYLDRFGRDRVRIYLYDDLRREPRGILQDLFGFIGVNPAFPVDVSTEYNASGAPRNQTLNQLLNQDNPIKRLLKPLLPPRFRSRWRAKLNRRNLGRPVLAPETRDQLRMLFHDDVVRLGRLLERDLSHWLA